MTDMTAGGVRYRIRTLEREGGWVAQAEQANSGARFGVEYAASTEADAVARVSTWLAWQAEHAAALDTLQTAERSYHRAIAGSAFVSPVEGSSAIERQKELLDHVEAASVRLDEVLARRPE